jgi:hypothetical protein
VVVDVDGTRSPAAIKAIKSNEVAPELDLEPMAIDLPLPPVDLQASMCEDLVP